MLYPRIILKEITTNKQCIVCYRNKLILKDTNGKLYHDLLLEVFVKPKNAKYFIHLSELIVHLLKNSGKCVYNSCTFSPNDVTMLLDLAERNFVREMYSDFQYLLIMQENEEGI